MLVTHDRYFLDDLVDRMLEINPDGSVTSWPGNYEAFLEQKLVAEEQSALGQHKRERWIAQEVAWLRRGPEARRTKSKARIQRARALMAEKGFARPRVAEFQVAPPPRLSQVVIEAHGLAKSFGGPQGPRGRWTSSCSAGSGSASSARTAPGRPPSCGCCSASSRPTPGKVVTGVRTRVAYHDQQRATLDPEQTVYEAAGGGAPGMAGEDFVTIGDRRVGLRDYLDDLLFPPVMQRMKVRALSGGERNRLLLARLFLEGANVLVARRAHERPRPRHPERPRAAAPRLRRAACCSSPTTGTSSTRWPPSILAFEGDGRAIRYPGNYETYRTLKAAVGGRAAPGAGAAGARRDDGDPAPPPGRRIVPAPGELSFNEQRELEGIEAAIQAAEERKAAAEASLSDPATYQRGGEGVAALRAEMEAAAAEAERLYARWQELESIAAAALKDGPG